MSKKKVEIKSGEVCISSERCRNGWEDRLSLTSFPVTATFCIDCEASQEERATFPEEFEQ